MKKIVKTPLKWLGNKTGIVARIAAHFQNNKRLVEPFCGSCAVALNSSFDDYYLADYSDHLINFYNHMAEDEAIEKMDELFRSNNPNGYYYIRDLFNAMSGSGPIHAAYYYYLNRHCFRGVMRYSKKSGFNVPYGNYLPALMLTDEIMHMDSLFRRKFHCADFRETFGIVQNGDTVYCDPPYLPKSDTANFTEYKADKFNYADHVMLDNLARSIVNSQPDTEVIVSNHNTDGVREIYKCATEFVDLDSPSKIDNKKVRKEVLIIYRGNGDSG